MKEVIVNMENINLDLAASNIIEALDDLALGFYHDHGLPVFDKHEEMKGIIKQIILYHAKLSH